MFITVAAHMPKHFNAVSKCGFSPHADVGAIVGPAGLSVSCWHISAE